MVTIKDILDRLSFIMIVIDENGNILWRNKENPKYDSFATWNNQGDFYIEETEHWIRIENQKLEKYQLLVITDITKDKKKEEGLKKQVFHDLVTGVSNRKGVSYQLDKAVEMHQTNKQNFTIVMADIDLFKNVNDIYGHAVGDEVLQAVGTLLSENIRRDDFVGRYGGEEFLIIFKTDDCEQIRHRLEDLRNKIETHLFWLNDQNLQITMTFGAHVYDGSKELSDVLKKADEALYYGKRNGRNRVVIYNDIEGTK